MLQNIQMQQAQYYPKMDLETACVYKAIQIAPLTYKAIQYSQMVQQARQPQMFV